MISIAIIIVALLIIIIIGTFFMFNWLTASPNDARIKNLSQHSFNSQESASKDELYSARARAREQNLKLEQKEAEKKVVNPKDQKVQFFQAGLFTPEDIDKFTRKYKFISFSLGPLLGLYFLALSGVLYAIMALVAGILVGRVLPDLALSRKIKARQMECSYYLPLIIEQLSIGVSSGLDIGPCVSYVVEMANERGANNVVTELLSHVMKLTKAGMSLEEALIEIGSICGYMPARNTFGFLAQCSRHGGEISKQLMELSEAVTNERQSIIETIIAGLGNKATMALGLIFFGFFIILLGAIGIRISEAFKV